MPEPLPGPVPQVLDGLDGRGVVQAPPPVMAAEHAHHLDVDDVGAA